MNKQTYAPPKFGTIYINQNVYPHEKWIWSGQEWERYYGGNPFNSSVTPSSKNTSSNENGYVRFTPGKVLP